MNVIYTGGTFDLFHSGHVNLLKRCREVAGNGLVVVSLNTDDFICSLKTRDQFVAKKKEWKFF